MPILQRPYGRATKAVLPLWSLDGRTKIAASALATTDIKLRKHGTDGVQIGATEDLALPTQVGLDLLWSWTAAQMSAAMVVNAVKDVTATAAFAEDSIILETTGHPATMNPDDFMLYAGTAAGGGTNYVDLDGATAPARIDPGSVIRLVSGTGAPGFGLVQSYSGVRATVAPWAGPAPAAGTLLAVYAGPSLTTTVAADIVTIGGSAARVADFAAMLKLSVPGTVIAGTITTTQLSTDILVPNQGQFKNRMWLFETGLLEDQQAEILDSDTNGLLSFRDPTNGLASVGDKGRIL